MRKIISLAAASALLISTTSVAFADDAASASVQAVSDEGALPAADPHAAQAEGTMYEVPGFGTLTAAQFTVFLGALAALGTAAAFAFASSGSTNHT
jgi:hypothetical protein